MNGQIDGHEFRWALAVGADMFAAVPHCSCGWKGGMCWNVRQAHEVWTKHVEPASTTVVPARTHTVNLNAGAFGMHVARCTCGWFSPPLGLADAQAAAGKHEGEYSSVGPLAAPAWFLDVWSADTFDADVDERDAIERQQRLRFRPEP